MEGGEETADEEVGCPDGTTFLIRQLFYNENNKPTNPSVMVPEGVCKYDKWGNLIYIAAMDGYGKLIRNPKTGWAVARYEYDVKGNKLLEAYYDKNDKPTLLNDEDYSKIEYAYDDKNNIVKKSKTSYHR